MGTQPPSPKRGRSPLLNFRPMSIVAKRLDMDQDGTWHGGGPWSSPHCARWGTSSPPPKKGAPNFRPIFTVAKRLVNQDGTWQGGGPWSKPHCARWGPSFPPQNGADPQFSVHFYCRQTAGCIKMPLGMEAGLSPGDFVLGGDPASPPLKGHSPPFFVQCPLWPNDWMEEDATVTWY